MLQNSLNKLSVNIFIYQQELKFKNNEKGFYTYHH